MTTHSQHLDAKVVPRSLRSLAAHAVRTVPARAAKPRALFIYKGMIAALKLSDFLGAKGVIPRRGV